MCHTYGQAGQIMLRSHARTVKPRQWHVTSGGHTIEKELRGGG